MTNIILCGGNGTRLWPQNNKLEVMNIKFFHEKPNLEITKKYINNNENIMATYS